MHVALLRGINVGGKRTIPMAGLRDLMRELGFAGAHTLLQTGNLIFDAGTRDRAELERYLESETKRRFGFAIEYLVRDAEQLERVVADNPFPAQARSDPAHLVVTVFKAVPPAGTVAALHALARGPELIAVRADRAYVFYPRGIAESNATLAAIERSASTRGTGRNWNTVLKVLAAVRD